MTPDTPNIAQMIIDAIPSAVATAAHALGSMVAAQPLSFIAIGAMVVLGLLVPQGKARRRRA